MRWLFPAMWLAWLAYWTASALRTKATRRREPLWSRAAHIVPLAVGAWLIAAQHLPAELARGWLEQRLPFAGRAAYVTGVLMALAGFAVTVWARVHLGRNWSGTVTIKHGHELVRTGPYAVVRHPIYSGLLLAFIGSALGRGEWRGVLAVVIVFLALWRKLRLEERWMAETFGEAYEHYRRDVKALIPGLL